MKYIVAFLLTIFSVFANAQEFRVEFLPPTIALTDPALKPMHLTKLDVDVQIHNDLAQTKMTMTFYNPNSRILAGDLYFPLPEGALINGYALDVKGVMVEGSIVKKAKARQVFEKEMRKGIDPGLVEYTKGNNYKTRVFPIPAEGTRTISLSYISDLHYENGTPQYLLPLNFKDKLQQFDLRIEAIKSQSIPVIAKGNLDNFGFTKWKDSYVAETSITDKSLTNDMIISLPRIANNPVIVEQAEDGEYYFYIKDFPRRAVLFGGALPQIKTPPKNIAIIWDASGSRANADHNRELVILETYLKALTKQNDIDVTLSILRNTISKKESFNITKNNIDELISTIKAIRYDGGTQMGAINEVIAGRTPDLYLLFTDGLSNFGKESSDKLSAPVYIISGANISNHPYLHNLASLTGGLYFNISKMTNESVIDGIGESPFSYMSFSALEGEIFDVYPSRPTSIDGATLMYSPFVFGGKLKTDNAKITLHYGASAGIASQATFHISKKDAHKGNILRTYWAQQKINELLIFEPKNDEAFVELGQEYGLVTPGTSLLVLENLEQYVEHEVVPPKSLPEIRKAYYEHTAKLEKQLAKQQNNKIENMVSLWNKRVKWWQKDFTSKHKKIINLQKTKDDVISSERSVENAPPASVARPAPIGNEDRDSSIATGVMSYQEPVDELSDVLSLEESESDIRGSINISANASREKKELKPSGGMNPGGEITLKAWNPDTPYLKALEAAKKKNHMDVYFKQRAEYSASPAFYLDCAEFFYRQNNSEMALQILSNITELELENPSLLRVAAHRLQQANELGLSRLLFEEVLKLRPEEPQSYRDLALVLAQLEDYRSAVELLYQVVLKDWDRFQEIELIALMELNHIIAKAKKAGITEFKIDKRLIKLLDLDLRIVMTWDADLTDIDLWVTEPSGEKAFYSNNRTQIGGLVSRDFTQGYGPEEYLLKDTMSGTYKIQANYYGSRSPELTGPVTLQLDIYSNYGQENEKHKSITLRLSSQKEIIDVGEVKF